MSTTGADWIRELSAFTARNAGRRTVLEVDGMDIGAQREEQGYPLRGVAYDPRDGRVEIMLGDALANLRAQGSAFGSNLSIVQNRQDFTKAMINTLETGGDNLVLADSNEEGANMLALQTRQQLSTTALSLSAQADQAVLRLFG